jgi:hypothetical protein
MPHSADTIKGQVPGYGCLDGGQYSVDIEGGGVERF